VHSPDPEFGAKVRRICDLYRRPPDGAVVLSIDEKPGIQALERRFDTHLAGLGGEQRREFEYVRHGTQALIAGLDVRSGEVFGQLCNHRTGENLVAFMEHVARRYPGQRIIVIWDNLNIHYDGRDSRWTRFNARHGGRFTFVYTPKHASWVNQIEIWFSTLERQLLKYGSFASIAVLREAIEKFIVDYNRRQARPFRWTFRGRFRDDHPRVHRGATVRRCQSNPTPKTGKLTLSKTSFTDMVSSICVSAAAAQC
jgi:transposase